jgi:hypothetical protein
MLWKKTMPNDGSGFCTLTHTPMKPDCHLLPFYCCIQRQIGRNSKVSPITVTSVATPYNRLAAVLQCFPDRRILNFFENNYWE